MACGNDQCIRYALDRLFDATWQQLEDGIDAAIDGDATAQATSKREPDDMLVEVVETVRRIERYMKRAPVASDSLVTPWSPQIAALKATPAES